MAIIRFHDGEMGSHFIGRHIQKSHPIDIIEIIKVRELIISVVSTSIVFVFSGPVFDVLSVLESNGIFPAVSYCPGSTTGPCLRRWGIEKVQ